MSKFICSLTCALFLFAGVINAQNSESVQNLSLEDVQQVSEFLPAQFKINSIADLNNIDVNQIEAVNYLLIEATDANKEVFGEKIKEIAKYPIFNQSIQVVNESKTGTSLTSNILAALVGSGLARSFVYIPLVTRNGFLSSLPTNQASTMGIAIGVGGAYLGMRFWNTLFPKTDRKYLLVKVSSLELLSLIEDLNPSEA